MGLQGSPNGHARALLSCSFNPSFPLPLTPFCFPFSSLLFFQIIIRLLLLCMAGCHFRVGTNGGIHDVKTKPSRKFFFFFHIVCRRDLWGKGGGLAFQTRLLSPFTLMNNMTPFFCSSTYPIKTKRPPPTTTKNQTPQYPSTTFRVAI